MIRNDKRNTFEGKGYWFYLSVLDTCRTCKKCMDGTPFLYKGKIKCHVQRDASII